MAGCLTFFHAGTGRLATSIVIASNTSNACPMFLDQIFHEASCVTLGHACTGCHAAGIIVTACRRAVLVALAGVRNEAFRIA